MYSGANYGRMLADESRVEPYVRALEAAVRPGSVVLDLGAGLGFFALVACRLGARRVYAVESDSIVQVAAEIAAANGFGDRVECVQARSTEIDLPEKVDLIIADLRGTLPWFGSNIRSMADARERFLEPGGVLIPRADTLRGAVADAGGSYEDRLGVWSSDLRGFDLEAGRKLAVNSYWRERMSMDQLLTGPTSGAVLDYAEQSDSDMQCVMRWTTDRAGVAHGLCLWFDTVLAEGIGFSSGPDSSTHAYGSMFFPLEEPVALEPGDEIEADVAARAFDGRYVWRWRTRISGSGGPKADFTQSSLLGMSLSQRDIERRSPGYSPRLSRDGELALATLEQFDGETTLGTLADSLSERFPGELDDLEQAIERVTRLAERFGR